MSDESLHNQLIKLGDMMGDGLHYEPDGKWIEREYKQICKLLGYTKPRKDNSEVINKKMEQRVKDVPCTKCNGELKQTRKGSMRAKCVDCDSKYQLMKMKKV